MVEIGADKIYTFCYIDELYERAAYVGHTGKTRRSAAADWLIIWK